MIRRTTEMERQRQRRLQMTNERREIERFIDRERHRLRRLVIKIQISVIMWGKCELCQYCQSLKFPNEK